ncbi:MAG: SPFH domain-containing protein [Pseudomonadota bacterium]
MPGLEPAPGRGYVRIAWALFAAGGVFGLLIAVIAVAAAVFGYGAALLQPLMACAALAWLCVAGWGPQAFAWSYLSRSDPTSAPAAAEGAEPRRPAGRRRAWLAPLAVIVGSGASLATWVLAWPSALQPDGLVWFGLLGLMAFPALILGNALAQEPHEGCRGRAPFVRFTTLSLLVTGLSLALQGVALPIDIVVGDAPLSVWTLRAMAAVQIAVAVEWIARAAATPFLPERSADGLNGSFVVDLLMSGGGAGGGFQEQFGVDFSQSWAVRFVRRISAWVLMGLVVATWLLTGVTTLRIDERGVYQRLGTASSELLEPGLHLHRPWPLGSVRRVDFGIVREVRLNASGPPPALEPAAIEAPSTRANDRIWSQDHGEELFLMIANQPRLNSGARGRQGAQRPYELYHADVVITYRAGLAPEASLAAAYNVADADGLVSRIGRRELVDLFNNRTAEDLLFADFSAFSRSSHDAIQRRLDALGTGIDVVDVIFEAVHPPIATAATFHRVHAAEKEAAALVDIARAEAERLRATALIAAAEANDRAKAEAFASAAQARAERLAFAAERRAFLQGRDVFEFERALQTFQGAFADKNLIIVDPRIVADQGFVLDLSEQAPREPSQN